MAMVEKVRDPSSLLRRRFSNISGEPTSDATIRLEKAGRKLGDNDPRSGFQFFSFKRWMDRAVSFIEKQTSVRVPGGDGDKTQVSFATLAKSTAEPELPEK
jgi:hypothetical protein